MASRRVRIKGIANIPQRRKNESKADNEAQSQETLNSSKEVTLPVNKSDDDKKENGEQSLNSCIELKKEYLLTQDLEADVKIKEKTFSTHTEIEKQSTESIGDQNGFNKDSTKENVKPASLRRNIIKPVIKMCRIIRKHQPNIITKTDKIKTVEQTNDGTDNDSSDKKEEKVVSLSEMEYSIDNAKGRTVNSLMQKSKNISKEMDENFIKPKSDTLVSYKAKIISIRKDESDSDVDMDMTGSKVNIDSKEDDAGLSGFITGIKRVHSSLSESGRSNSDIEYPMPPSSPSKILGRRIKAVPCLAQRRISFSVHGSASESEDESRRNFKRIRNDSVSSAVSCSTDNLKVEMPSSASKAREFNSVIQRKCRRTEQSRRMAEARREFNLKFGKGIPDRQKLTMMDLIFYNPTSNPMSQKKRQKKKDDKEVDDPEDSRQTEEMTVEEEKIPEKQEEDPPHKSDEEGDVLAPQIKIGPNGEIVVDEQSLVIENKEVKKNRENLQKSEIVDGDFDTGFNGYKRINKPKDWSKSETLRFFKALNTIGTDFSIMAELFPDRTRRELKMKFKREERVNRILVDKALTQPIEFDMTDLRIDLEREKREKEEMVKREKEALEAKKKAKCQTVKTRGGKMAKYLDSNNSTAKKQPKAFKAKKHPYSYIQKGIASVLNSDSDDDDEIRSKNDDNSEDSDSDKSLMTEKILFPTRSGRVPKPSTRLSYPGPDVKAILHKVPKVHADNYQSIDFSQMKPGSLVITLSETPDGPIYKVFRVTDNQEACSIDLGPEIIESLSNGTQEATCLITDHPTTTSKEGRKGPEENLSQERTKTLTALINEQSRDNSILVNEGKTVIPVKRETPVVAEDAPIQEHRFVLPVKMCELQDINLTIAHTDESDLQSRGSKERKKSSDQGSKAKIIVQENILISAPVEHNSEENRTLCSEKGDNGENDGQGPERT